jgi:hypothetical protein
MNKAVFLAILVGGIVLMIYGVAASDSVLMFLIFSPALLRTKQYGCWSVELSR